MIEFTIAPFVGTIPLRFGMKPADVTALLGPPSWSFRNPVGILIEERTCINVNVSYSAADELNEAVFSKGTVLNYEGQNLLEIPDPVSILRRHNTGYKWLSSVVFPSIGVGCTGIGQDDDTAECEWTITVAVKGQWDEYKDDFVVLS